MTGRDSLDRLPSGNLVADFAVKHQYDKDEHRIGRGVAVAVASGEGPAVGIRDEDVGGGIRLTATDQINDVEHVDDDRICFFQTPDVGYFWSIAECNGLMTEVTQCCEGVGFEMGQAIASTSDKVPRKSKNNEVGEKMFVMLGNIKEEMFGKKR